MQAHSSIFPQILPPYLREHALFETVDALVADGELLRLVATLKSVFAYNAVKTRDPDYEVCLQRQSHVLDLMAKLL